MDFREITEFIKDISKYIIIIAVMLLLVIFVISFHQVLGPSMTPTVKENSIVLVNKLIYNLRDIKRNEIIILKHDEKLMIKRVIGLPGEHIEYKDNVLYIDDVAYKEKFLESGVVTDDYDTSVIPEDKYFVLGDNRSNSLDGNDFGLIDKKDIVGKAWIIVWPLSEFKIY